MSVVIETTVGDVTVDLYTDARPRTCMNFLKLCKMKYYNFNLMFSVQRNFIAQMGDPSSTGKGGSCIFEKMYGAQAKFYEGEKLPLLKHTRLGTLSMVACGDHLFGSQFFITLGENLDSLDGQHLVFGEVVEGMEVVHKLNQVLADEHHRPYQDIRISHTVVLEDPYPDPPQLAYPPQSPLPAEDVLASEYIAADEAVDDTQGKSMEEIQEEIQEREAKARATILEMVGDLPDSDTAPPENVLFVCKLNPVTTSEDLEIIFSRFGKIKSCEVIRDRITNNSLQYGFIEFEDTKSCEDGYFKMDNVLIDDRRIHVDFSQSVSRIKWKGKGRGVEYFDSSGKKVEANRRDQSYNPSRDQQGGSQARGKHSNNTDVGVQRQGSHREFQRPQVERNREAGSTNSHHHHHHHKHKHRHEENNGRIESQQTGHKRRASQVEEEIDLSNNRDRKKMLKQLKKSLKKKKKKKKSKKYSSDSDDSDSDSSEEEERKKKKSKKKKKKKLASDSDSDSDSEPKKKSKKSKKKKKKKKKESSTSESSD